MACVDDRVLVAAEPRRAVRGRAVWDTLDVIPLDGARAGGWWLGLLSYDLGTAIEVLPTPHPDPGGPPRAWLGEYPAVVEYSPRGCRVCVDHPDTPRPDWLTDLRPSAPTAGPTRPSPWTSSLPPPVYRARVEDIRQLIRAGDCYQVNLAQRLVTAAPADLWGFAERLWRAARSPSMRAFLGLEEGTLISASPERLVQVRDAVAISQPIKGTIAAGHFAELSQSPKDRAEHVMIVDLVRNDLGRIADTGAVSVPSLMAPMSTGYVDHMVSTVRAGCAAGTTAADLVWALFPGGSVTGCPKVRSMEVIHACEPVNRGPAFGSMLVSCPDGDIDASILIRTAWQTGDELRYWCGGAVTWDSHPAAEHDEAMAKARPFLEAIT